MKFLKLLLIALIVAAASIGIVIPFGSILGWIIVFNFVSGVIGDVAVRRLNGKSFGDKFESYDWVIFGIHMILGYPTLLGAIFRPDIMRRH